VEVRDAQGKQWWYADFRDRDRPFHHYLRHALWNDHHGNYSFYMPRIPPGNYTLTMTVKDITRPNAQRVAQKSLEFRVGM
jgi:hypothetical protein